MPAPIIVFDLDGTLIDTAPVLVDTLNIIFPREGLPPVPYETARNSTGGGARGMITRGIEADGSVVGPEKLELMFADFVAHYSAHIADRSRPFPGLTDALDMLASDGFHFAVCTNKLERLSRLRLDALNLTHRFATICGQDTFGVQNQIRMCCTERSRPPAARSNARSWSAIPALTFALRVPPAFRSLRSTSATVKSLWQNWAGPDHQPLQAAAGRNFRHIPAELTTSVRLMVNAVKVNGPRMVAPVSRQP